MCNRWKEKAPICSTLFINTVERESLIFLSRHVNKMFLLFSCINSLYSKMTIIDLLTTVFQSCMHVIDFSRAFVVFLTLLNDKKTRCKNAMNIINRAELPLTSAFFFGIYWSLFSTLILNNPSLFNLDIYSSFMSWAVGRSNKVIKLNWGLNSHLSQHFLELELYFFEIVQ